MSDTSGGFGSSMAARLMQSMGINPQEIVDTVNGYGKTINAFAVQLNTQQALLTNINDKLDVIIQRMNANGKDNAIAGAAGGSTAGNGTTKA